MVFLTKIKCFPKSKYLDEELGKKASRVYVNLKSGHFPNQNRETCTGKKTASWEAFIWMNEVDD